MVQERVQRLCIDIVHAFEERFRLCVQPAFVFAFSQQLGRQHRRKGQSHKGRYRYGAGDHDTELLEQASRHAFHKDDREEHGHECYRRRHDGEEYLFRPVYTGLFRFHSLLDADVDVLRHHDRVVHHQSDREHHRQHCQHIDGEAGDIHHKECPDQ